MILSSTRRTTADPRLQQPNDRLSSVELGQASRESNQGASIASKLYVFHNLPSGSSPKDKLRLNYRCRQRRIQCDEKRPACTQCTRSKKTCAGYHPPARSAWSSQDGKAAQTPMSRDRGGEPPFGLVVEPVLSPRQPQLRFRGLVLICIASSRHASICKCHSSNTAD